MSLDKVELELQHIFASGQAYVALSRCRSLQGLAINSFDAKAVFANPQVLAFYKKHRLSCGVDVFDSIPKLASPALDEAQPDC